jgi:hypothetical protein
VDREELNPAATLVLSNEAVQLLDGRRFDVNEIATSPSHAIKGVVKRPQIP